MTNLHEPQVNCPVCDDPNLWVCVEYDATAPEIGMYSPSFSGTITEQACSCKLTDRQLSDIAEEYFDNFISFS